ncbi:MAG TPA: carbohydrate ABC transporter permease [Symbiobacteriaceae bacterium]|nr:carbohydrate ABC transporter permease [Symbiobacteriaceae bacterium]
MEAKHKDERGMMRWVILISLGLVLIVSLFPFLYMASTALRPRAEIFRYPPAWLPQVWAWRNFVDIWTAVPLARYVLNSVIIAGGSTVLNMLCAIPAAYALARLKFRGRKLLRHLLLTTQMFSPIVLIIGLFKLVVAAHLQNTYLSLIMTYAALSVAFSVWFLAGYFEAVPEEIEQAAQVDGCSRLGALTRVVLPMSAPAIIAALVFAFIWAWNDFMIALTFVSTPEMRPLTLGIYSFLGQYLIEWHYLMAASLVTVVPVVLLFFSIEKYLVKGLTAGAIK